MSPPNDYTKTLYDVAIKQVVADLVKEKAGRQGSMSSRVGQDSYTVKLTSLVDMGIPISYNALAQRVNCEFKNHIGI